MKLALDARKGERDADRRTKQNERRENMLFSLLGAAVLAGFLIICMRMGQAQIATEAIKPRSCADLRLRWLPVRRAEVLKGKGLILIYNIKTRLLTRLTALARLSPLV
jgi:hypothetical protein